MIGVRLDKGLAFEAGCERVLIEPKIVKRRTAHGSGLGRVRWVWRERTHGSRRYGDSVSAGTALGAYNMPGILSP